MNKSDIARRWLAAALVLVLTAGPLALSVRGAEPPSRIGTIDEIRHDDGLIVIDGVSLGYRDSEVTVRYRREPVRSTVLSAGYRISYRLNQAGRIGEITLLGPLRMLEQIDQH